MKEDTRLEDKFAQKKQVEELLEHPGWKIVAATLVAQVRARRIGVFGKQISGLDSAFELAAVQGECAGVQLALGMPEIILADLAADINVLLTEEREKEGEDTHGRE